AGIGEIGGGWLEIRRRQVQIQHLSYLQFVGLPIQAGEVFKRTTAVGNQTQLLAVLPELLALVHGTERQRHEIRRLAEVEVVAAESGHGAEDMAGYLPVERQRRIAVAKIGEITRTQVGTGSRHRPPGLAGTEQVDGSA